MLNQGEITKIIQNGPRSTEAAFEGWTNGSNRDRTPLERYASYIGILKNNSDNTGGQAAFLAGYFNQRMAAYCPEDGERLTYFMSSLANYRSFLSGKQVSSDTGYFAQWQIGLLQQSTGSEWSMAEENYLHAQEYDPKRGEALREIIGYWVSKKNWRMALIYSSYCKQHLLRTPPEKARWFINIPFYQWKILKYHVPILVNLNRKAEAKECAEELFNYNWGSSVSDPAETQEINKLKEAWRQWL